MKVMTAAMKRVLDRQLKKWAPLEEERPCHKKPDIHVVTVSRQPGSGGKLVAAEVALKLKLPYVDREIVEKVAERAKAEHEAVESRDGGGIRCWRGGWTPWSTSASCCPNDTCGTCT